MKLSKSDPRFQALPTAVEETLPDWNQMPYLGSPGFAPAAIMKQQITFDNAQIFQLASQIGLGGIVTNTGAPTLMFNTMVSAIGFDVQKAAVEALEHVYGSIHDALSEATEDNGVINQGLNAGIGLSVDLVTTVPVVGWVVKIAWNVGKMIYKIVQLIKEQKEEQAKGLEYPATRFNPELDRDFLNNAILSKIRSSNDWTNMFMPPGLGVPGDAAWQGPIGYIDLEGKKAVRIQSTNPGPKWIGFVPGTNWLHQAIEYYNNGVHEVGETLCPSAQQHCLWLWRHVSKPNVPAAFTVHADVVESSWQTYIDDMRVYLNETDVVNEEMRNQIFSYYNAKNGKKIFGWGNGSSEKDYEPAKLAKLLRTRQLSLLDTITCAYIDQSFGALKDPAVKQKWQTNRQKLLEHPALCTLDLNNIPDELYREEVRQRQGTNLCFAAPVGLVGNQAGPVALPGYVYPVDLPQNDAMPQSGPRTYAEKRDYKKIMLVTALAAAGYYKRDEISSLISRLRRKVR